MQNKQLFTAFFAIYITNYEERLIFSHKKCLFGLQIFVNQDIANIIIIWYNFFRTLKQEGNLMQKFGFCLRLIVGTAGFFMLFIADFLFIFFALAVFSLGLIVFPAALLGMFGAVIIITDIGLPVLAISGAGTVLLGAGLCLAAGIACYNSFNLLCSFRKGTQWRERRLRDEQG